ncbi:MAG: phenylacetate-CoA oxygenase subunit PaaC, partial [Bacteroidia bacterium]|nr:phenylacetate-CoA oxygenase subunit PaaC [Bacteroidia bacterium]
MLNEKETAFKYTLQLADNSLIISQRLSEWCGHGPVLEQDIALTNIALDLLGQSASLFEYAASLENKGRSDDDLAMKRVENDYLNVLLVEYPNTDFAYTVVRQFFFDQFNFLLFNELKNSKDLTIAAVANKSIKEITYHKKWSSEWLIRLGDGTDVSHAKMQAAINELWSFTGEMFEMGTVDKDALALGIGPDLSILKKEWDVIVSDIISRATLTKPSNNWMQTGGKSGNHSEY